MALFGFLKKQKQQPLPEDSLEVLKLWQKASAENDHNLLFRTAQRLVDDGYAFHWSLGECYMHGWGVAKDSSRAISHFDLALKEGSAKDMGRYADLLNDGVYLNRDKEKALSLYRSAAALEDPHSCLYLYRLQTAGQLPDPQYTANELAWMLFIAAIDNEPGAVELFHKHALEHVETGKGYYVLANVTNDPDMRLQNAKIAASYGYPRGLVYLAALYYKRNDPRATLRYLEAAVALYNDVDTMYNIGVLYNENRCFWDNWEENMLYWYTRAAENGQSDAANNLGVYYKELDKKEERKSSIKKALYWFHRSAELGNETAMFNLYTIYTEGVITPKDPAKAEEYLLKAAELGCEEAIQIIKTRRSGQ